MAKNSPPTPHSTGDAMTHEAYYRNLFAALRDGGFHDFTVRIEAEVYIGRQIGDEPLIEQLAATDEPILLTMSHTSGHAANILFTITGPEDRIADFGASHEDMMAHLDTVIEGVTQ